MDPATIRFTLALLAALLLTPLAALHAVDGSREKDFGSLFRLADKDRDGKVDRQEAGKARWHKLERMDADGDGVVTLAEAEKSSQRGTRPAGVPMS